MKTYNIVYKTTNKINGKFYIGCHSTDCLDDGYLGSGRLLKLAIKKYGRENFIREVLATCVSQEVSFTVETHLVKYYIDNFYRSVYNRAYGGSGAVKGSGNAFYGKKHSSESRKRMSESRSKSFVGEGNPFYGKKHKAELKDFFIENGRKTKDLPNTIKGNMKRSEFWWCTPNFCSLSVTELTRLTGLSKSCIHVRCKNPDKVVTKSSNEPENIGKTWRQVGYYRVNKHQQD